MNQETTRKRLLVKVLQMYYLENQTQEAIARKSGVSRATIVRLLAEGREEGLVKITIRDPLLESFDLERRLKAAYNLSEALVASLTPTDPSKLKGAIGELAAEYILGNIRDGMMLAVSAGSTMYAVSTCLQPSTFKNVSVISLHGGCNEKSTINPDDIARSFAEKLGAKCFYINAPALAESRQKRNAIISERRIQAILAKIRHANMAIVGIGDLSAHTLVVKSNLPDGDALIAEVLRKGAVGELLGHYFAEDGRKIDCEMDNRIIGIGIDELKRIPIVAAVAGGESKIKAIESVLRSGFCNALVTDIGTARALLNDPALPATQGGSSSARAPGNSATRS
jgi:DNA-binding transcriptional regulator LsrR (DeoR family)